MVKVRKKRLPVRTDQFLVHLNERHWNILMAIRDRAGTMPRAVTLVIDYMAEMPPDRWPAPGERPDRRETRHALNVRLTKHQFTQLNMMRGAYRTRATAFRTALDCYWRDNADRMLPSTPKTVIAAAPA